MESSNKELEIDLNKKNDLIKIIKRYSNLFKSLYYIDQAIAAEFKKKQEIFFNEKHKNRTHKHKHEDKNDEKSSHSCCNKLDNKIYIPFDKMNNIEKNLKE